MLDTVIAAETPEGMLLELRPAGLSARFHAFLIDWLIRMVVVYVLAMASAFGGGIGTGLWLVVLFALEWLYPIVFELSPRGATPGKRALGLRVVMENGLPVTPAASVARNILRAADFLPFAYGAAVLSILFRADARRLGDLAAGTLVVHDVQVESGSPLSEAVLPLAPAMPLSRRGQAALVALAARVPTLTPERLDELTALAAEVSGDAGQQGPRVTERVLGVAQWVLGRRR